LNSLIVLSTHLDPSDDVFDYFTGFQWGHKHNSHHHHQHHSHTHQSSNHRKTFHSLPNSRKSPSYNSITVDPNRRKNIQSLQTPSKSLDPRHFESLLQQAGDHDDNPEETLNDDGSVRVAAKSDKTGLKKKSHLPTSSVHETTGIIERVGKQRSLSDESHTGYESLKDVRRRRYFLKHSFRFYDYLGYSFSFFLFFS
jgi:hypothetical protein